MARKKRLLDRSPMEGARERSAAQERRIAKEVVGRVQPASGARWHSKGDVKSAQLLVEAKTTQAESFSVRADVLKKIRLEALMSGKMPVLQVDMAGRSYAVIDWDWFCEMFNDTKDRIDNGTSRQVEGEDTNPGVARAGKGGANTEEEPSPFKEPTARTNPVEW